MEDLQNNKNYSQWLKELKSRYQDAQIKASVFVNKELLQFYFELGNDIEEKSFANEYGSGFFNKLSRDLTSALPNRKGFFPRNLNYAHKFYLLYNAILQQPVAKFTLDDLTFALPSGMNRMMKVYTSDIFKISPNFFHVVLYFDKKDRDLNVTENVTERQRQILSLIQKDDKITASELATELAVTRMTINRDISVLKSLKILERIGGDKGGHWKVIK